MRILSALTLKLKFVQGQGYIKKNTGVKFLTVEIYFLYSLALMQKYRILLAKDKSTPD